MNYLMEALHEAESNLVDLIARVEDASNGLPGEGKLWISDFRKNPMYIHVTESDGIREKKYIRKSEMNLAKNLAQKEYNEQVLTIARDELTSIRRLIDSYDENALANTFDNLNYKRRILVTPVCLSDEAYAKQWQEREYDKKPFAEGTPEINTFRGERVRSKSEKIIADLLDRIGIPYLYECPLQISKNLIIYPDFTILNKRLRKVYYLEHLGMMDNPDYISSAIKRIDLYEDAGIFLGEGLIITHETSEKPINLKNVEKMFNKLFL